MLFYYDVNLVTRIELSDYNQVGEVDGELLEAITQPAKRRRRRRKRKIIKVSILNHFGFGDKLSLFNNTSILSLDFRNIFLSFNNFAMCSFLGLPYSVPRQALQPTPVHHQGSNQTGCTRRRPRIDPDFDGNRNHSGDYVNNVEAMSPACHDKPGRRLGSCTWSCCILKI